MIIVTQRFIQFCTPHQQMFFSFVCVAPAGSDDTGEQNDATCQSNQEENADQQVESEEDMDNTDLDDSAVS